MTALPGRWGLTSAVPVHAGAADAASEAVLAEIVAALAGGGVTAGPLGGRPRPAAQRTHVTHACAACGASDHGVPSLSGVGVPPGTLVSFTHVAGVDGTRLKVGAWWVPMSAEPGQDRALGLGLDLERVDAPAFADQGGLGAVGFTAAERAWTRAWTSAVRPEARARLWTRKEALVKAAGTGFTGDPAAVDALLPARGTPVLDLPRGAVVPGTVGALALRLSAPSPS